MLFLAGRRQWLQERDQSHREETDAASQAHQQRLATLTELDATERRITDLYTKAVDQLGSEKAPVRLGGLYALERLAQDNPNQRQTIVNVICAYLRMPYAVASGELTDFEEPDSINAKARQELQVRLTAQRILAAHLNRLVDFQIEPDEVWEETVRGDDPLPSKTRKFWDDISIDLTGATLINLDFSGCAFASVECSKSIFIGGANFRTATFTDNANFRAAAFDSKDTSLPAAIFRDAEFEGDVNFHGANFSGDAVFYVTEFKGTAIFASAQFAEAHFDKSEFDSLAFFGDATFARAASFINVIFSGPTDFTDVTFTQDNLFAGADFHGARFDTEPDFSGATIYNAQVAGPEVDRQFWPEGWVVERGKDDIGQLVYKDDE